MTTILTLAPQEAASLVDATAFNPTARVDYVSGLVFGTRDPRGRQSCGWNSRDGATGDRPHVQQDTYRHFTVILWCSAE